jgi:carboxyl-terminal processing protease
LRLRGFNQQTAQRLSDLLAKAHRDMGSNLHGLVLDLRDNPGGLLSQSVEVARLFLSHGDVVSTIGRNPQAEQHYDATADHPTESLPMVVLINGGSASASEIVAAALQDDGRAVVVGTSSYGKGTVQTVLRTSNDGELAITWARLVTPRGYLLHHHGVIPTICTADLADDAASVAKVLSGDPSPVPTELAAARKTLNEAGWQKLRGSCQPGQEARNIDTQVADRLLDNPKLYHVVLGCFAPITGQNVASRAEE